jgi:radical SAM protein with 4Fe4S-binding SPASM domain
MEDKKYYCTRPFEWFAVLDNGDVSPCCPPWIDGYRIGNLYEQSVDEVWNGEKAQDFRRSILDGSFEYCNSLSCPFLQSKTDSVLTLHQIEGINPLVHDDIKNEKTKLEHGPRVISCEYDRSCNLACPSCRRDLIMVFGEKRNKILELQDKIISEAMPSARHLTVTGSGDAFASPIFRKLLQRLSKENAPNLGEILILTNGLLIKKYWETLSEFSRENINSISISIDAATEETYVVNRKGGKWSQLLENLEFVQKLKQSDQIDGFAMSMVVQENNFMEIKDFVLLAEKYGAGLVQLQIIEPDFIRDLGFLDYFTEWEKKAIQEKTHPLHQKFLAVLKDPFFDDYINKFSDHMRLSKGQREQDALCMNIGPLYDLREGRDISQRDEVLKEANIIQENSDKKDVFFDGNVYYVNNDDVISIDYTDFVVLDTKLVVFWNGSSWQECKDKEKLRLMGMTDEQT